ncbi:hypothetical protein DB30_06158 [Enhygromyxa salina]|uniref:Uncharacterized protein n=1 Tax=Enhygromyxa salina TaxID=215803 RepID=A0A0C1ZB98_9BACT|nr:hypothetical protein DB30_06158 [Enhygromyxa salina]
MQAPSSIASHAKDREKLWERLTDMDLFCMGRKVVSSWTSRHMRPAPCD